MSLNLFKTLNENTPTPTTELVRPLDQIVCTRRQVFFELLRSNIKRSKLARMQMKINSTMQEN